MSLYTAQNFVTVQSLDQALELLEKRGNLVLGGGCWLRLGSRKLNTLIDLSALNLDRIEDRGEEIALGAMVTLRELEVNEVLREHWGNYFYEMTRHIVGVQFRNCATLGGSVAARFGFSDILTGLMALDCQVELARGGRMDLEEFARTGAGRDVLTHVILKTTPRRAVYRSAQNSQTDLPTLTCAVSERDGQFRLAVGARPYRAQVLEDVAPGELKERLNQLRYGSNMRAGAEYRRHLAGVLARRGMQALKEGKV